VVDLDEDGCVNVLDARMILQAAVESIRIAVIGEIT